MAALQGTLVASKIVPTDSEDTFATHDEKYGRGGYRSVDTLVDRDSISHERRKEGMLVYVLENDTTYKLTGGIDNANWQTFNLNSAKKTLQYIAGDIVNAHRAVMLNSVGQLVVANPLDALSVIGISLNAGNPGDPVNVSNTETVEDMSWNWIPGLPIFFIDSGVLTQTPPTTVSSMVLGIATNPTAILIQKMNPIFLL